MSASVISRTVVVRRHAVELVDLKIWWGPEVRPRQVHIPLRCE
jgi:hypothetical protein